MQLLVHGGNRAYWDTPDGGNYSYQRDMAAAGYATFAIDDLRPGDSSQPLTVSTAATVVHQVVARLRSGSVGGNPFGRVVLTGDSTGSGIVVLAAAAYRDVDGVVLTGMSQSTDLLKLIDVPVLIASGQDDRSAAIRMWLQGNVDI
ncbi:hypothetical protein ALI144C_48640 [Actinosynnema sp. ALI-1.44]|uniref:alpha/beta hydrolase n=1 Tax=Actinosynnema sp. ALI-1.44 TaxID=1933779 RepID=UPI00097C7F1C|nr:hypothetical protein [Actinosynnema sp. ALI-1.44]ONI70516.1 hypothetical protein ALI144C_48640 [Actinosynnema sp. ALI-1.44]